MISEKEKFEKLLQVLKAHFHPTKIFLFGSRAKGSARADSDYDLLLVVEDSRSSRLERMQEASGLMIQNQIFLPADIIVYTKEEFDLRRELFGSVAEAAATEGVELDIAG
jgi:predicted nucleotidyltransferase